MVVANLEDSVTCENCQNRVIGQSRARVGREERAPDRAVNRLLFTPQSMKRPLAGLDSRGRGRAGKCLFGKRLFSLGDRFLEELAQRVPGQAESLGELDLAHARLGEG